MSESSSYFVKKFSWPWPKLFTIVLVDYPQTSGEILYVLRGSLSPLWFLDHDITPDIIVAALYPEQMDEARRICQSVIPADRPHTNLIHR